MNLLEETIEDIRASGHSPDQIVFIGSVESGHSCTWAEFSALADFEYDDGFGAQKVASDLLIAFGDGSTMWRHEYDGSECWKYSVPFKTPLASLPIRSLFVPPSRVGWMTVAEIQKESAPEARVSETPRAESSGRLQQGGDK